MDDLSAGGFVKADGRWARRINQSTQFVCIRVHSWLKTPIVALSTGATECAQPPNITLFFCVFCVFCGYHLVFEPGDGG